MDLHELSIPLVEIELEASFRAPDFQALSNTQKFLRQDADMVDLQQMGLKYDPTLLLIEDSDTQAKWYHAIKREWTKSRAEERAFKNPVKSKTLKWRS